MADDGIIRTRVRLHLIHDLGGGSAKWLRDFARADAGCENLVLRSFTHDDNAGGGVALYGSPFDEDPLRAWTFEAEIPAVAVSHPAYRAALEDVLASRGVDAIFVSSLIGHSLDALDTTLPTVVVTHDYFPYCPAINLYFDGRCERCDGARLARCAEENPRFQPFVGFPPEDRERVRSRYLDLVRRPNVVMAVPSRSVEENLKRMDDAFRDAVFVEIPHGYADPPRPLTVDPPSATDRLRVVVLGQLSVAKGVEILKEAVPEIARFAEIYFLGCRELGELFRYEPHVHLVSVYEPGELAGHMASINPHVGVLASIVPETFSYTLSELMALGVPPAATRVGSFPERIRDGENGFLYEPDAAALVDVLSKIDADRAMLGAVRERLRGHRERSADEMVEGYRRLAPRDAAPPPHAAAAPVKVSEGAAAREVATVASMWREVKRLSLQLGVVNEARHREHQHIEALERQRADTDARLKERERQLDEAHYRILEQQGNLLDKDRHLQVLSGQLQVRIAQLAEIQSSTIWKVTEPVRLASAGVHKLKVLARSLATMARHPREAPKMLRALHRAFREGGAHELKKALIALQSTEGYEKLWTEYRAAFEQHVRPNIVRRIDAMARRPRISVLVPTYNTPEPMLREMLDSVLAQLYPEWELCVADDGSSASHVARVLREYAARDRRVKLHLGEPNRGVSHASNAALALATGEFVVLLDHDDRLEEQALFRVAESVLEDDPDMLYSDEMLVSGGGAVVRRLAYRPAFSLEYLRSHPYIVHMVGFRRSLLEEIGGFDESLRISQDYDLILRAAEKSRRIVHIPEILYQWRLHDSSAGEQRMKEVMETSRAVIARHLARCGEEATVEEGPGFNLFAVRRPLRPELRVAIVIPTKNHGELVRQCIDSLRATIREARYDVVVIDHESDDAETVRYLASLAPEVRVFRYEGPFNFSAINNFAVSKLGDTYTHYLFCNNDIEAIRPGWLERMLELAEQPGIGIVGAKLLYPDRLGIQHAGVCVGAYGAAEHYAKRMRFPGDPIEAGYADVLLQVNHEVAAVTAACMLVRRDAFEAIAGFDDTIAVGFGDVDLCLRILEKGWRIVFCPFAELVHHESYTRGTSVADPHPHDSALYRLKWKRFLEDGDPFHNPGLSLDHVDWRVQRPLHCSLEVRRRIVEREPSGLERVSVRRAR
jgi:GT2 family glycosyltransferase/glycosyltransferase involved in cell wall biosynthesis